MNIGIVLYPTFGGSGVIATELGKALASAGHKVHFITYKQPVKLDVFTDNITFHEVRVSDYPLFEYQPYEFVLSSKLVDVCKFENLDLLHVHYAIPHASAAYMAKQILASEGIQIPVVTTLHGTDITLVGKDSSFEPVITFAINQSDVVTTVSESLKEDTYRHFQVKKEIDVVPNFVCLGDYDALPRNGSLKHSFAPNGERVLIHVSNFRPVKRIEDVVRIFERVRKNMPAKLLMVGDGPERHRVEELCRQSDVCGDVKFLGKVKDTERIVSVADLFLLTSETESFGLAALEAMAAKVPVISTNQGGLPEVNVNEVTGYLCNVGDVEDMANKAIHILSEDERLQTFKDSAYEQAKTFSIEKIIPQYMNLYERAIEQI